MIVGKPAIFLYDRYKGGLGFCEKAYGLLRRIMEDVLRIIDDCPCETGCPSCVGLPVLRPPQHQDPDPGHGYPIPDKATAAFLVRRILEIA